MIESNSQNTVETEARILGAARDVFERKGYSGARMQEIANLAGINKSLLHYYFRSKDKLFSAVFSLAFKQISSKLKFIGDPAISVYDKIEKFYQVHMSILLRNPNLPVFILNELNHNPQLLIRNLRNKNFANNLDVLKSQIREEIDNGNLKPVEPEQLILNLMSMCIFPFAGATILKELLKLNTTKYKEMLKKRKKSLPEYVLKTIRT